MTAEPGTRVALYMRVSTNGKKDDGSPKQNLDLQVHALREFCEKHGWVIADEFLDRVSGSKASRPGLDKLMAAATSTEHPFDAVLVWKLDRFGRSLNHLLNNVEKLTTARVSFVSLTDGFDLTTPQGRLMFGMLSCCAEFERELIRERVSAGIRQAQAKAKLEGRVRGAGRAPLAFDVDAVRARMAAGESQRQIAKSLGISPSLITKRLRGVS